jgi:hypothetical protein
MRKRLYVRDECYTKYLNLKLRYEDENDNLSYVSELVSLNNILDGKLIKLSDENLENLKGARVPKDIFEEIVYKLNQFRGVVFKYQKKHFLSRSRKGIFRRGSS